MRMTHAKLRFHLSHLAEELAILTFKSHRHLTHFQVEHDLLCRRLLIQMPGRPQSGVTCKRQFLIDGEDANSVPLALLRRRIAWKNERRFRQIGLARQLLHLLVAETAGIADDSELVALKRTAGEDVELNHRIGTVGHARTPWTNYQERCSELSKEQKSYRVTCQCCIGWLQWRRLSRCGSEGGPVTLPVFKTGDWHLRCQWCVRLAHASAIPLSFPRLRSGFRPSTPLRAGSAGSHSRLQVGSTCSKPLFEATIPNNSLNRDSRGYACRESHGAIFWQEPGP